LSTVPKIIKIDGNIKNSTHDKIKPTQPIKLTFLIEKPTMIIINQKNNINGFA
jgi:hypothetical protein